MNIFIGLAVLILGSIVGSFLNVVILRLNNKMTRSQRSVCMSCGHVLSWRDLIPVLSYVFLRGRCRYCHSRFSAQYAITETTTAIAFLLVIFRGGVINMDSIFDMHFMVYTMVLWVLTSLLVVMTFYDVKHKIVPLQASVPFVSISFLSIFFASDAIRFIDVFLGMDFWSGIFLALPFLALWAISRGRWIGFGDIFLMFGIGWLLGLEGGITAVLLAFWSATLFLIVILLPALYMWNKSLCNVKKGSIMKAEIPLIPFLALGTFSVLITGFNMFTFLGLW